MCLSIVFIGAHPDDETVLAGGTLHMLSQRGHQTHVVCATRGEGGEVGEPPVVLDRRELGHIREQELRCACQVMGVHQVSILDYVDPTIGEGEALYPFAADFDVLVKQIRHYVADADVVLTHGSDGEYGHPAHQLLHRATLEAVKPTSCMMYGMAALVPDVEDRLWNQSDLAHLVLNIAPWADVKVAAMECHVSQHALFKRRRKLTHVYQALRPWESFHRHWPPGQPDDALARVLLAAGARQVIHD